MKNLLQETDQGSSTRDCEPPDLLSPDAVLRLDENLIGDIAAETADSQTERARVLRKLKSLKAGLQTLGRLDIHKPAGTSHLHDSSYL